jgi:hypothetical protein
VALSSQALCVSPFSPAQAHTHRVLPDPNNPLEPMPDTVTFTPYGESISLENAKKVAAAEVAKRNWRGAFCISVSDTSGELVYFERGENCQFASIAISQHKARASARYRRPTVVFERLLGKGPYYASSVGRLPARAAAIRALSDHWCDWSERRNRFAG